MREPFIVHRQMGCTFNELLYWLPAATDEIPFELVKKEALTEIHFQNDGLLMRVNEGVPRKIALLVIPVLEVNFQFSHVWDIAKINQFMKRFDLYTRRGGG